LAQVPLQQSLNVRQAAPPAPQTIPELEPEAPELEFEPPPSLHTPTQLAFAAAAVRSPSA
jgi:hypothetical protein